ncbi:MAG: hypothetical protein ACXW1W_14505 [Methylococcaceae bacterium]
MTFIMMIMGSALVGWLAQSWKGRTGAVWGGITLLVMIPSWFFIYFGLYNIGPTLFDSDIGWYLTGLFVSVGVTVLMAIIVATLPKTTKQSI